MYSHVTPYSDSAYGQKRPLWTRYAQPVVLASIDVTSPLHSSTPPKLWSKCSSCRASGTLRLSDFSAKLLLEFSTIFALFTQIYRLFCSLKLCANYLCTDADKYLNPAKIACFTLAVKVECVTNEPTSDFRTYV